MAMRAEILSLLRSGNAARRAGLFSDAFERLSEAAALCGPENVLERAQVLREMGELARNRGDLPAAQGHYEEAVALLNATDDRLRFAHAIRHLGDVHAEQQHWPDAERCLVEAVEIYRHHGSPAVLDFANAVRPLAALMAETGRKDEARLYWMEARELYRTAGIAVAVEECDRQMAGN